MAERQQIEFTLYGPQELEGKTPRAVETIKAIRYLTGLGLRDAKAAYDNAVVGEMEVPLRTQSSWDFADFMRQVASLRAVSGLKVKVNSDETEEYAEELRQLAVKATLSKNYYVAEAINSLLRERF